MRLLVTRPADDAERTARALETLGHETVISPALHVRYQIDVALSASAFQAILVTSSNAVAALSRHRRAKAMAGTRILAVGDRTAVVARRAGFTTALSAGGNVDDLVDLVHDHRDPGKGPLLYAAGENQASDLAARLSPAGFDVETVIVYRTEPTKGLSPGAVTGLEAGTIDGVLFFSVRSADYFGKQLDAAGLSPLPENVTCFCLSEAIGRVVRGFAAGAVPVAPEPNQLALFAMIENATNLSEN